MNDERQAIESQMLANTLNDAVVTMQAAWIEAQHGGGAESAMQWIHNYLVPPGIAPGQFDEEPYCREAQAWYDSHRSDPFPVCPCGRPSNILSDGKGYCSDACREAAR